LLKLIAKKKFIKNKFCNCLIKLFDFASNIFN